jgi:hypothetical protein
VRKDIDIPEVTDVHIAIVREWNTEYEWFDWYAYVINERKLPLEMVMVVSKGSDGQRKTATMRHAFPVVGSRDSQKVELIQAEVLEFDNQFDLSFFCEGKLYDKSFRFPKGSVSEKTIGKLPLLESKGTMAN